MTTTGLRQFRIAVLFCASLLIFGCATERDARIPDGALRESAIGISNIQGARILVETETEQHVQALSAELADFQDRPSVVVKSHNANKDATPFVEGLYFEGTPGETYELVLQVTSKALTVYRVVNEGESLSAIQSGIVESGQILFGEQDTNMYIPLSQHSVQQYGKWTRTRNDLEEQTNSLRLVEVPFDEATIVAIAPVPEQRKPISLLPDGAFRDNAIASSKIQDVRISVRTAQKAIKKVEDSDLRAYQEKPTVRVAAHDAPIELAPFVKDLAFVGTPGDSYELVLKINRKFLTVFRKVKDDEKISAVDAGIIESGIELFGDKDTAQYIPISQHPVQSYGRVVRSRNDIEEATNVLRIQEVSWDQATIVSVVPVPERRQPISISPDINEDFEEYFLTDRINGMVTTASDLQKKLSISVGVDGKDDALYTVINGDKLDIYTVTTLENPQINETMRLEFEAGKEFPELLKCPASVTSALTSVDAETCVLLSSYYVGLSHVVAERERVGDIDSFYGSRVIFRASTDGENSSIVRITRNAEPTYVWIPNRGRRIQVGDYSAKEFMLMRTLLDSPSNFPVTFPGSQGPTEIVKFKFLEDRIDIERADALTNRPTTNSIDKEVLMSFSTRYFKEVFYDTEGREITNGRWIQTSHRDKEAIAFFDWVENSTPTTLSPLSYFGIGRCFQGGNNGSIISDLKNKPEEGILNFTLESNYSVNPNIRCYSGYLSGSFQSYFYQGQATYAFKERISFKEYDAMEKDSKALTQTITAANIPYEAQKAMKFGTFTFDRTNPTENGFSGIIGTQDHYSMLHDFTDGKVLTYYLGGTEGDRDQEAIIQATREVIEDWNEAFHRAFKGTELERTGHYVELKVDGIDVEPGKLGDLERNYIWWVQKEYISGVLGIGGPSPSPRTGIIHTANVTMYGGNLRRFIESYRRRVVAQTNYRVKKEEVYQAALAELEATLAEQAAAAEVPVTVDPASAPAEATPGEADPAFANFLNFLEDNSEELDENSSDEKESILNAALNEVYNKSRLAVYKAQASSVDQMKNVGLKLSASDLAPNIEAASFQNRLSRTTLDSFAKTRNSERVFDKGFYKNPRVEAFFGEELGQKEAWLQKIFDFASEQGDLHSGSSVEAYALSILPEFMPEIVKGLKDKGQGLRDRAVELSMQSEFRENYTASRHCMMEASFFGNDQLFELSDAEILIHEYKFTLAHEIGHNVGLRHNFAGSADERNFKFDDEEETDRNYSTVMDYIAPDVVRYDGPGTQDVYTIRAAYTQLLEVDPAFVEANPDVASTLVDGKFATIDQFMESLGEGVTFYNMNDYMSQYAGIPLRPFNYCSDGETYNESLCNVYDEGHSATEITDLAIERYKGMYEYVNFSLDKTDFGLWDLGGYINYLFREFYTIRGFMDETFIKVLTGEGMSFPGKEEADMSYDEFNTFNHFQAAITGWRFFLDLVHTPDAIAGDDQETRFVPIAHEVANEDGTTTPSIAIMEKKWLYESYTNNFGKLNRIGTTFDKAIGLMMLTQRQASNVVRTGGDISTPLRFSYLDFERFLLGIDKVEESPIALTLYEILKDDLIPWVETANGGLLTLDSNYEFGSDVSTLMRSIAISSSVLGLYVDSIEQSYNYATHFRVGSQKGKPEGRDSVTYIDVDFDDRDGRHFYAISGENSSVAHNLVTEASQLRAFSDDNSPLKKSMDAFLEAHVAVQINPLILDGTIPDISIVDKAIIQNLADSLPAKDAALVAELDAMGFTFENGAPFSGILDEANGTAAQAQQMASIFGPQALQGLAEESQTRAVETKRIPLLGLVYDSIHTLLQSETSKITPFLTPAMASLVPSGVNSSSYGMIRANLDTMNFYYSLIEPAERNR